MSIIATRAVLAALFLVMAGPAFAGGKPTPLPPGTGPFTIQLFVGKSQRVIVALDPPQMFAGGAKIADGTAFTFKLYRSPDGVKPYSPIPILSGEKGTTGKPYGAIALNVPVNDEPPYLVFLGASVVINGVESAMTTNDLNFSYFPGLTRFATPMAALAKKAAVVPVDPKTKLVPNPPGTGPFTVQAFTGKTQRVALALDPPKTFVGGAVIPAGTSYTFKIYRSVNGGKNYTPIPVVAGDKGTTGQPYGAIAIDVPVNNETPYLVFLGASVVINGVESAMVTNNLTFAYFPGLTRFATPKDALGSADKTVADKSLDGEWRLIFDDRSEPGSLTIKIKDHSFTGTISWKKASDGVITLDGKVKDRTYDFRWTFTAKGETTSGTARLTLSADGRKLVGEIGLGGERSPIQFNIDGRTIRFVNPKKK